MRKLVANQSAQIESLTQIVSELELQLAKAKKKDSSNSSKLPPSDITKAGEKKKKKTGWPRKRKTGGLLGHARKRYRQNALTKRSNMKSCESLRTPWKQRKNFFDFLLKSINAKLQRKEAPSFFA